jgi:hypothetical protein
MYGTDLCAYYLYKESKTFFGQKCTYTGTYMSHNAYPCARFEEWKASLSGHLLLLQMMQINKK